MSNTYAYCQDWNRNVKAAVVGKAHKSNLKPSVWNVIRKHYARLDYPVITETLDIWKVGWESSVKEDLFSLFIYFILHS